MANFTYKLGGCDLTNLCYKTELFNRMYNFANTLEVREAARLELEEINWLEFFYRLGSLGRPQIPEPDLSLEDRVKSLKTEILEAKDQLKSLDQLRTWPEPVRKPPAPEPPTTAYEIVRSLREARKQRELENWRFE
jgi:hypothetical protein